VLLELQRFEVLPGERLVLRDVGWHEFEAIVESLSSPRSSRIAYTKNRLEIVMPLAEHEDAKEIISDLLKTLMEELEIEFRSLGSTIFKKPDDHGLEPDQCFYIKNEAIIRGKKRLDMTIDPPPDLAIEIDITSRTYPNIYAQLQVPELWQFEQGLLSIKVLENGEYINVAESPNFPGFNLIQIIPDFLKQSETIGRNALIKSFRQWIHNVKNKAQK
jgi:Uma2 family endonuclease